METTTAQRGLEKVVPLNDATGKVKRRAFDLRPAVAGLVAAIRPLDAACVINVEPSPRAKPGAEIDEHHPYHSKHRPEPPEQFRRLRAAATGESDEQPAIKAVKLTDSESPAVPHISFFSRTDCRA